MDTLVSVVTQQLVAAKDQPLRSLQLQNHLYGCFLVMEDIADRILYLTGDRLMGEHLSIDLTQRISQIGLRYGFVMDTRAQLDSVDKAYQDAWIQWFRAIDETHEMAKVDATEDALNAVLRTHVGEDMAFFANASETGSLSQAWISKLLALLDPESATEDVSPPPSPPPQENALSHAQTESPMIRSSRRRLAHTRRRQAADGSVAAVASLPSTKRALGKTRRRV